METERDDCSPSSASDPLAVSRQTRCPEKAGNRRKNGSSKAFALLDTLIERIQKDNVRYERHPQYLLLRSETTIKSLKPRRRNHRYPVG